MNKVPKTAATAIAAATLVLSSVASASAASSWQTLKTTPRHDKAQICRYWTTVYYGGVARDTPAWHYRASAVGSKQPAQAQVQVSDPSGLSLYVWTKWAQPGHPGPYVVANDGRPQWLYIRMRVRTPNGKSSWSSWHRWKYLTHC